MITEIPLSSEPNQSYTVTIPGANKNITFIITQSYNGQAGYWVIGIYDKAYNPIVLNIPLLCGYDILEQYQYLDIGSLCIVNIGDSTIENPDNENIANNFELVWVLQ